MQKRIQKKYQKIVAIFIAIVMAVSTFTVPVFAETSPVERETIERYSTDPDDIIALCAGSISNGTGYLNCYLATGNFYSTIQAKTASNGITGAVDCFVEFPDGTSYALGTIPASNGTTTPVNFHLCPYGYYKFIFETNFTDEIEVMGFIYD